MYFYGRLWIVAQEVVLKNPFLCVSDMFGPGLNCGSLTHGVAVMNGIFYHCLNSYLL